MAHDFQRYFLRGQAKQWKSDYKNNWLVNRIGTYTKLYILLI